MKELVENKPDLVFTTADASEWEGIPVGYVDKWKQFGETWYKCLCYKGYS